MATINKFNPVKTGPESERQLVLLRLSLAGDCNQVPQLQRWSRNGWRPVALDDDFVGAFNPTGAAESAAEGAEELNFPEGARVLLLLPGNWVWSGVEVIPKAARRQSSAVGYIVEERLAEDVEDLHFTCQPRNGELCSVFAVAADKMDALHSQLQRLSWPLIAVLPEYQLLDLLDGDIVLWLDGDQAHIWLKAGYGLSVRRQYLQPLLSSLSSEEEGEESRSPRLQLLGAGDDDGMTVAELESLFEDRLECVQGFPEEVLMARCKPTQLVNLMSGSYELASGEEDRDWWRKPAKVAAACFVAQLLLFTAAGGYFQWRANNAEQQARALFSELFPQDRPGVDIRRQLEGYLKRADGSGGSFASQMQLLSRVWGGQKERELKLQSLRFDGNRGEMVLQLQASNLSDLDSLVGRLSEGEFRADLLGANELEKGVSGRIRLR